MPNRECGTVHAAYCRLKVSGSVNRISGLFLRPILGIFAFRNSIAMTMTDKYKILFVCLGNICRSPAAEGIMRALVEREGLNDRFEIDSAGTYAGHRGELPDVRMRDAAARRG